MPTPCESCKESCKGGKAACGSNCNCGPTCCCGDGKPSDSKPCCKGNATKK